MISKDSDSPVAWWNGQFVTAASPTVSIFDAGFVQGLTVAEQLRTFNGQLFRLQEHLDRLFQSLSIVGVDPGLDRGQLAEIAVEVALRNHQLLDAEDDLGLALWVTPGPYAKFESIAEPGPKVCCHANPLDFSAWSAKYDAGVRLVTSRHRQVSPENWPVELKCRSRMHYYLADKEAREEDPAARALLLDLAGFVCEASTANVLVVFPGEGLVSPLKERILPGISLAVIEELATSLELGFVARDIHPQELRSASEMLICSTSSCLLPVARIDDTCFESIPGPTTNQLIQAWNEMTGVDMKQQALRFANRTMF